VLLKWQVIVEPIIAIIVVGVTGWTVIDVMNSKLDFAIAY